MPFTSITPQKICLGTHVLKLDGGDSRRRMTLERLNMVNSQWPDHIYENRTLTHNFCNKQLRKPNHSFCKIDPQSQDLLSNCQLP